MDTELVESAQHGDKGAFTSLAAAVADRFLATSHRILRDISLAEDATQQALLTVWQDLPQLRDPARFDAWSYRILVRACYAEAKRMRRWTPNIHLLPADEPVAPDGLGSVVDRDQLERGFRRLSLDHRTVVVLHHYLDLPLDQVAEVDRHPGRDGRISTSPCDARAARGARRRCADGTGGRAMSATDRDVTGIVRSWLHEDEHENADRVLDLVLDQLDTTPQRRARWPARRFPPMNTALRIGLAAAAVLALALLGMQIPRWKQYRRPGGNRHADPHTHAGGVLRTQWCRSRPGHVILDGEFPLAIEFDVPAEWAAEAGAEVADEVSLSRVRGDLTPVWVEFSIVDNVFPDPCHPVGMEPPLGPTVDDLVNALTSMAGSEAGVVSDVEVDGYAGKRFDLSTTVVPADAGCDDEVWLSLWSGTGATTVQVPGPTNMRFTVVDVDGTRVAMWTQYWDATTPAEVAEVAEANAIVDSVRFR